MGGDHGVIFDMDGVLVLSGPLHWTAWRAVAAAHGIELTRAQFLSFNGFTNPDIVARLWGRGVTTAFAADIADCKEQAFRTALAGSVPLAPGCRELLLALRCSGALLAVGSSAPRENVDLVLDGGGIRAQFRAVVHADMVRRGKPAPDIFLRAAELLGLPPARCIVVEDAPSGVQAARAAGMRSIGVLTNHPADELRAAGASAVYDDLAAIGLDAISVLLAAG